MKKLIAVYGTLKKGQGNNRRMGASKLLGTHVTEPNYTMYSLAGFPAVVKQGSTPITVEVFEVTDPTTLEGIYSLEGYSGTRDSDDNWYDTTDVETPYGTAEMFYFKEPMPNYPVVENGIW